MEGLAEQVGVEHPRKLISFTLTGEPRGLYNRKTSNLKHVLVTHSATVMTFVML